MPTAWWLRPVSSAWRVGEHSAVVWNRLYFRPRAASRSAVGVAIGPPKALDAPNPQSSIRTTSTFGAPAGGRNGSIGGNDVSGSLASYVTKPTCARSGIGRTERCTSVIDRTPSGHSLLAVPAVRSRSPGPAVPDSRTGVAAERNAEGRFRLAAGSHRYIT